MAYACSGLVVRLTDEEMNKAAKVAKDLHDRLRSRGIRDGHGLRKEDATERMEAGGAQSELAVAKHFNVPWSAGEEGHDKLGPDVGKRTQVRSSQKPRSSHLIIRTTDIVKYKDVPFILVTQQGNEFTLRGWIMAYEGVAKGKLWDGGDTKRPDAYFIHESKLNAMETLDAKDV